MSPHDVSIIIPCFNKVDFTIRCLEALAAHTPPDRYEVIVVDNASSDGTQELCAALEGDVEVIRNGENLGFARACNQGADAARGEHLLFLNNDTEVRSRWLEPLLDALDREPDLGAVGAKLLYPDGSVQHGGVALVEAEGRCPLVAVHRFHHQSSDAPGVDVRCDLQAVTAAVVAIRRRAFEQVGGFDEGYWNGYEDVDLCLKLGANGWRVLYEPRSVVTHAESASGPERWTHVNENTQRLLDRWVGRVEPDVRVDEHGRSLAHLA